MTKNNCSFYLVEGGYAIDWNKKHPYLCNRYVMPEHRNKGLGSDLVWLRCNEVIKRGYKKIIMLEVGTNYIKGYETREYLLLY